MNETEGVAGRCNSALVIGAGNPLRHDDGVGPVVVQLLTDVAPPGVEVVEDSGEATDLINRWTGRDHVVLVDAVSSGAPAGTVHRLALGGPEGRWELPDAGGGISTHGLGLADAIELGQLLGRLPTALTIFGVEVADVSLGRGLTDAVAAALPGLLSSIVAEVGAQGLRHEGTDPLPLRAARAPAWEAVRTAH